MNEEMERLLETARRIANPDIVVRNDSGEYYTGSGWTGEVENAKRYADLADAIFDTMLGTRGGAFYIERI